MAYNSINGDQHSKMKINRQNFQQKRNAPKYIGEGRRLPNLTIPIGTKCKILTADKDIVVSVINIGREQYEVRMPDLSTGWFYQHELEPITD